MRNLKPSEIVSTLDKTIIGQEEAKASIAVSFRDRWRRQQLPAKDKKWVPVRNVLIKGPSGTAKTELARQVASLCDFPFVQTEATSFTSRGYVGGNVTDCLKMLLKEAEKIHPKVVENYKLENSKSIEFKVGFESKILRNLFAVLRKKHSGVVRKALTEHERLLRAAIKEGKGLDDELVLPKLVKAPIPHTMTTHSCVAEYGKVEKPLTMRHVFRLLMFFWGGESSIISGYTKASSKKEIQVILNKTIEEVSEGATKLSMKRVKSWNEGNGFFANNEWMRRALQQLEGEEPEDPFNFDEYENDIDVYIKALLSDDVTVVLPVEIRTPLALAENYGVVFIDEIDKLVDQGGGKVNGVEVQYELLKVIEGGDIDLDQNNSGLEKGAGRMNTSNILFIAAGAFANVGESSLISEMRGRLPIQIRLHSLSAQHLEDILTKSAKSPLLAIQHLLATDGINLKITDDAIRSIASMSYELNQAEEDLGARRLNQLLTIVLQPYSFETSSGDIVVGLEDVEKRICEFYDKDTLTVNITKVKNNDMSRWRDYLRHSPDSPVLDEIIRLLTKGRKIKVSAAAYSTFSKICHGAFVLCDDPSDFIKKIVSNVFERYYTLTPKEWELLPRDSKDSDVKVVDVAAISAASANLIASVLKQDTAGYTNEEANAHMSMYFVLPETQRDEVSRLELKKA